ncbi:hypothetical protein [Nonomuraea aurantiaca]|uniref:hypothetical protein n=1 Tax=Nonomuraea aurantiaca TaxID=2878562 RepID=UPI001CD9C738|nr:hypothetical protein [Nonomuraea aurantiaca]MCA2230140.1 hypothetical protein [Nonomuraea aurantiaca]
MLHTTDTQRIYKMVGGAPVWQSTCADNICQPQPQPTTQAVINAGPATPRNGASAINQQGAIYLFVGGAPIWQDSCAAPVSCGTPVKVSTWSIDARDHMNQVPADGNLVQSKAGAVDLPVAMTIGGALMPFASEQEVIDVGQGSNWRERVVAISANSYNLLGFNPVDGTLVQGTGGGKSGPVAMVVGGAFIPFASAQEVIDVGQGSNWASKVRAIPLRIYDARPRMPCDSTLIQGTSGGTSSPVATVVGGARVNFASEREVIDSGYGTDWPSKVRAIPLRAFNELRDDMPSDGTLVQGQGTAVAAIIGGARVNFASEQELLDSGYRGDWRPTVRIIPPRVFNAMSTTISDGTRIGRSGSTSEAAVVGGAKVAFISGAERDAAGYGSRPLQVIPARVWDALPTQISDGTRIGRSGSTSEAAVVGGAKVAFISGAERDAAGYGSRPLQVIPARVWDALPTQISDGTRIGRSGSTSEAAVVGGAKVAFISGAERDAAGYGSRPLQVIPARVWDALPTQISDGTYVKSPDSASVWLINTGHRTLVQQTGNVQVIPTRVLDAIPLS